MTDIEIEKHLARFIENIKARYPHKLNSIDLRFLYYVAVRELMKEKFPEGMNLSIPLNNALIFCATDTILRQSRDITWDILIELKTQKPYLGIKVA